MTAKDRLSDDAVAGRLSDTLEPDFSLEEVATAIGMSTRWIRDRVKHDGAEHIRYGHKIRFTAAMVDKLRAAHTVAHPVAPVTTGPAKKAS